MRENRFNLIDEKWIPVAEVGLVSLRAVFSSTDIRAVSGTPLQKIAVLKLLLAIAQAACTPKDDDEWAVLGAEGMAKTCCSYLEKWHDRFYLYGEKPFLQMPTVEKAVLQEYCAIMPEIASGNATVLTQWQTSQAVADAGRALLLLVNMSCCFGGKKVDSKIVLSSGHTKKSGKAGPALCSGGLLHTFLTGASLLETIWLNILTKDSIKQSAVYTKGFGVAPWEQMPAGEICETAQNLQVSLVGRLIPLARFCLLKEEGLHFVEGIQHPDYQQGYVDPSTSMNASGKKVKMLWVDPEKRPWQSLSSMLSFLLAESEGSSWHCQHIKDGIPRLNKTSVEHFGIWSGGIAVSSNAGEQYLTGPDDIVESELFLDTEDINTTWVMALQKTMAEMDAVSRKLYGAVMAYFKEAKSANSDKYAASATHLYWQFAEHHFQDVLNACNEMKEEPRHRVLQHIVAEAHKVFDTTCPQGTARQLQAWAQCRPKFVNYTRTT